MRERVCKNCGGREYKVVGQNMVKCAFCGTLYVDEHASKEEEVLLVGARELAREMRFEEAVAEFDKILSLFPLSFEAYFGKALAKNRILLYSSKKGTASRPRFFEEVVSISEDEDFKKAVELAPQEVAASYEKTARAIKKIKKDYDDALSKNTYDVVMCATGFDKASADEKIAKTYDNLKKSGKKVYFLQDLPQKELESDTFPALVSSKVLLFFAHSKTGYGEFKHLLDRWQNFVILRQKPKTSFVLAIDEWIIPREKLPAEFSFCKNVIDTNSISFLQDVEVIIKNEIENFVGETAKIDTIKLKKVAPKKKEYVDIKSVTPTELGHYEVENVNISEKAKIKWIYLSLKNGDFATAQELVNAELEKDPYSSEILFAQLMAQRQIKTPEDFFSSITNFTDKETLDNILRYASKDFAQNFVDNWEKLVVSLDAEEYYCAFLIYLASFQTPNRENFVKAAEEKAVETQNEDLIEKVLKCFDKEDVNRFVQFYFALAQKSDNEKYYQKILELDSGHIQSNMSVLLKHFKSPQDKLSYRNREELEGIFQFLDEEAREQVVSAIVEQILSVAFYDLEKCEQQLDFYLAYVSDDKKLAELAKFVALQFQHMSFFQQAEKYASIAISKDKQQAELYWLLIEIKAHCKSDSELIISDVKVSQMPEWQTLLEVSDDAQGEYYASIVSKGNLYKGRKLPFQPSMQDKVQLKEKLTDFLLRNEKILLEIEKQEGEKAQSGVNYFRSQLVPFEKYITDIDTKTFEEYCALVKKIYERLELLGLNLDASVSVLQVLHRCGDAKIESTSAQVENPENLSTSEDLREKQRKNKSLKRFLCVFLEFYPLLFTTLLLCFVTFLPKAAFMYFSQTFIICSFVYCVLVGLGNFAYYVIKKKKLSKNCKAINLSLFAIAAINILLFCFGFCFLPKQIEISSTKEFQTLLQNAGNSQFVLKEDLDFEGKTWQSFDFHGTLNGNGHTISNINLSKGGLFKKNSGKIENLKIALAPTSLQNVALFGAFAQKNSGEISRCAVSGDVKLSSNINSVLGGIVASNDGGKIFQCESNMKIEIEIADASIMVGGLVGTSKASQISENAANVNITIEGNSSSVIAGGLVGHTQNVCKNNYATGSISTLHQTGSGFVGGLFGKISSTSLTNEALHSYSSVAIDTTFTSGLLVGQLGARISNCFATLDGKLEGEVLPYCGSVDCFNLLGIFYNSSLGFDSNIWKISETSHPILQWQTENA